MSSFLCTYYTTQFLATLSLSGVHTGEVVVVRVSEDEVRTVEVVKWHAKPITTLTSHGLVLATGDDEGHITVAQDDQGLQNICCIDTYG